MGGADDRLQFTEALKAYLDGGGEPALLRAYELGRSAVNTGRSVLDVSSAYKHALITLFEEDPARDPVELLQRSEPFLLESLSSFDMSQRAVTEANSILRRLNHMLEEEAGRVAHALHDEAGGILASARIELDLAARDLPDTVLDRIGHVRQLLDRTGEQLRHLSHELRPMILDDLGLVPALEYLAEGIKQRSGLDVVVRGSLAGRLDPAIELAIYRAVQEALNNTIRHGGDVPQASVRVEKRRSELYCVIEDEGSGFDVDATLAEKGKSKMGLAGIRERVKALGGTLDIQSAPGAGTAIFLRIPVQE